MRTKIVHVISGLALAGAETILYRLLAGMHRDLFDCEVVSLTTGGLTARRIQALGIPVKTLGLRRSATNWNPAPLLGLARWLRSRAPDVVQTWLYHADAFAGLAARIGTKAPVVWNIRHGGEIDRSDRHLRWVVRANVILARHVPSQIVCCADSTRRWHAELGYPLERMTVIPNGLDLEHFRPDESIRAAVRAELGIDDDTPLVGMVARFHPTKDPRTLVRAAGRVHAQRPDAKFLFCGWAMDAGNAELAAWIREAKLEGAVRLVGRREDVARIAAALDVSWTASTAEAFPNVLAEAMACGVPCVATDVGDSRTIVGDAGLVVPPRSEEALADACLELLALPNATRRELGLAARRRVAERYSLREMIGRYEDLYASLAGARGEAVAPIAAGAP